MYIKENVNPANHKTGDCVTRAISKATGVAWADVIQLQCEAAKKTMYSLGSTEVIDDILSSFGFEQIKLGKIKKGMKRPTVEEIAKKTLTEFKSAVCSVSNHLVACTGGNVYDIWNSSNKSVYRYWVKR